MLTELCRRPPSHGTAGGYTHAPGCTPTSLVRRPTCMSRLTRGLAVLRAPAPTLRVAEPGALADLGRRALQVLAHGGQLSCRARPGRAYASIDSNNSYSCVTEETETLMLILLSMFVFVMGDIFARNCNVHLG